MTPSEKADGVLPAQHSYRRARTSLPRQPYKRPLEMASSRTALLTTGPLKS